MSGLKRHSPWILCLLISISSGASGGYIWAKALAAQVLLRHAWHETSATAHHRPWPWADTHPVGRLLSPHHGIDLVVLSGTSGPTLAFGPGHQPGSAKPGSDGHVILAAHRDTHFSFLQDVELGEALWLEGRDRTRVQYDVVGLKVVDQSETHYLDQSQGGTLTLVTCYPFDSPVSGGPLRYLVQLSRADQSSSYVQENGS